MVIKEISEQKPAESFINASVINRRHPDSMKAHPVAISSYLEVYSVSLDAFPVTSILIMIIPLARISPPIV